jgi:prepilin peptidase CpaA
MTSHDACVLVVVSVLMIVGAVIDGWKLKVPNWLTFGMILSGWAFWGFHGWSAWGASLGGTWVAGALLIVPYAIGGMGAGDVKLYAGFGAWMVPLDWFGYEHLLWAFAASVVLGGAMAGCMILWKRSWYLNLENVKDILTDLQTSGSVGEIAERAKARKPSLQLLPYGIPLTIGSLSYIGYLLALTVPMALLLAT